MWQSFRNYFWTNQLAIGLAMAIKLGIQGWRWADYGPLLTASLCAVAGFVAVSPLAALCAWFWAAYDRRQPVRPKPRILLMVAVSVAIVAILFIAAAVLEPVA